MNHNKTMLKIFNDNKHLKHILTSEKVNRMCNIENRFPFAKLPVCNNCERLGLWCGDDGYCDTCGTYSRNPMTYSEYLSNGYDIDSSGATFRSLTERQKTEEAKKRILYVPSA